MSSLKKFLHSKAEAFLSNEYYDSDIAWMELVSELLFWFLSPFSANDKILLSCLFITYVPFILKWSAANSLIVESQDEVAMNCFSSSLLIVIYLFIYCELYF